jgi:hypothetical protein
MIIGISGRARAGKDTVAEIFIKKFGFKRVSFADSLKEICSEAFGIELDTFHNNDKKDVAFENPLQVNIDHMQSLVMLLKGAGCAPSQAQIDSLIDEGLSMQFVSPRDLLQRVGTNLCRNHFGDSVWISIFKHKIQNTQGHTVVADVRFVNERQAIRDLEGVNFLVSRDSLPPLATDAHESELLGCSPENIQVFVTNDSTVASLHRDIETWWGVKSRNLR